jgi:hypothetical protein
VATATSVVSLVELNEYLYYAWNIGTGLGASKIGRYYGINNTYIDTYKDLGVDFPLDGPVYRIAAYKGNLIAGLSGAHISHSPGLDVQGTWLNATSNSIGHGLGFPPTQFFVF